MLLIRLRRKAISAASLRGWLRAKKPAPLRMPVFGLFEIGQARGQRPETRGQRPEARDQRPVLYSLAAAQEKEKSLRKAVSPYAHRIGATKKCRDETTIPIRT